MPSSTSASNGSGSGSDVQDQRTSSPGKGLSKSKGVGQLESVLVVSEGASEPTTAATTLRDSTRTISQSDADDGGEAAAAEDLLPAIAGASTSDYLSGVKRKYVPQQQTSPGPLVVPASTSQQFFNGSGASDFAVRIVDFLDNKIGLNGSGVF